MVRHTTGVGIECASCGLTTGHYDANENVRCDECGRFATPSDDYCARHDLDKTRTPSDMGCPRCRQEADREARIAERQARRSDPNMHNTIDAQANAIDHSRGYEDFM